MSICRKMVEGGTVAFPCSLGLPEGHAGPCAATEKPASMTRRDAWLRENYPTDSGYVEPRRSVEFVVEAGSISKVPGQPEPESVLATDLVAEPLIEVTEAKGGRPTRLQVDQVIDYLLSAHAGWENWYELIRVREQLQEAVDDLWQGRIEQARELLIEIIERLPSDSSE